MSGGKTTNLTKLASGSEWNKEKKSKKPIHAASKRNAKEIKNQKYNIIPPTL
jgi:hypothetical protein